MAKYNITRQVPEGFLHSAGFNEIIDSLAWALSSLGHEVNVTQNWFSEQREHNIIFGAELLSDFQRLPKDSTIFNLEQPGHPHMEKVRRMAKESGCRVWDYSHRAIAEWKEAGIEATHVPIGYTPNLTRIPSSDNQDIDILFYGWMTPRRVQLLDELRKYGLSVVSTSACYGGGRDNLISRSKLVLNIHHDGRDRFEIVRCSYLMANSKCVVSETSSDSDEYTDLERGLATVPYRLIPDFCRSLIASPGDRVHTQDNALGCIKRRNFTDAVEAALDATPSTPQISRPMEFRLENSNKRKNFISEARNLRGKDPRVSARYKLAQENGDMKDFVGWMRKHAQGNIVEIGTRDGASTSAFLAGVEEHGGHVYSIDVQPCGGLFEGHPQWTFIQANSTDIDSIIPQIPFEIDLLLIDGDHSRAGVISDFQYARQLRAGGLVLFHDIAPEIKPSDCGDSSWPGDDVKRVYEELATALILMGWTHLELPGRYGMGVLKKTPMIPPAPIEVPQAESAK